MVKPLALVLYEKLIPGGQLVTRLEDRGYRVKALSASDSLLDFAQREKPLLVFIDLDLRNGRGADAIEQLRRDERTSHIPVIAIAGAENSSGQTAARNAGATLVVQGNAILAHLDQFLAQALEV